MSDIPASRFPSSTSAIIKPFKNPARQANVDTFARVIHYGRVNFCDGPNPSCEFRIRLMIGNLGGSRDGLSVINCGFDPQFDGLLGASNCFVDSLIGR